MFSWIQLEKLAAGAWQVAPSPAAAGVDSVFDDSQAALPGSLFVAIGKGHDYLDQAVGRGASAVLVDRELPPEQLQALRERQLPVLRTADALAAFHALAAAHRRSCSALKVFALTGSCGKTTTKEMVAAVLARRYGQGQLLKTQGNWNNHFGVPRMLLALRPEHQVAVLELGTNHHGEIRVLAEMARPQVGIITNIGQAHLEHLGSLEGVAEEKGSLFASLPESGLAILPEACPQKEILRRLARGRRLKTFGHGPEADLQAVYHGPRPNGKFLVELFWKGQGKGHPLEWGFAGEHQALNAAAAALAGSEAGLSPEEILAGLSECTVPGMRMLRQEIGGAAWINDAYNANPDSMVASLKCIREGAGDGPQVFLVLGDMLELGGHAPQAHFRVLELARRLFPQATILAVGPHMAACADGMARPCADAAAAKAVLAAEVRPGATVFLKASRGLRLETCLP